MLSRSAQGLYWMGRYLERAEQLCRLLKLQTEALVDCPVREIDSGWKRIYGSLGRQPPAGAIEMEGDDYMLADSYTLADDLTFERSNPGSVWSCFALGRENARQMRHCISAEMWTCLNLAYLRIQNLDIKTIWRSAPESFYSQTIAEINTFAGVAESTMYRGNGWNFMRLGHLIERTQLAVALLVYQMGADSRITEDSDSGWTTLLRVYDAFEAYDRRHNVEVRADQVLDLLVSDPLLPKSLRRSIDEATATLSAIGPGGGIESGDGAHRSAGRLAGLIHYEWPDSGESHTLLTRMSEHCYHLHGLLAEVYFDYPIEDAPDS